MEKKGNGKRIFAIIGIIILLSVIVFVISFSLSKGKRAEVKLKTLAGIFYKYYYEDNSDKKDKDKIKVFLSNYAASGLTIKLTDMETYIDTHKVEDYKLLKKCDKEKTTIVIYPKAPYNKEDYEIRLNMNCNF